ncbi:unnamed protein product [Adineta steineri]|uniref:protein-tyrosine-phosphatase n=1 Tax=Adineta steineri TaxID=433720 RepID=A0A813RI39_9BILA|nr:unnamed protein product [Adineta steineri]
MSTVDQNQTSQYRQTIIIGSGTAGLSAAYQLQKLGCKSVFILEGSNRIGGRILTEYLDKDLTQPLEMGACWMHGLQENPVYELAQRENFPSHTGTILSFDIGTCVDEHGLQISSDLHHEVDEFFESLLQDTRDLFEYQQQNNTQISSTSIHKVFLEKFENFVNLNGGDQETRCLKLKLLQRSATIACMWLMRRYKLSANIALKRLRLARPIVHPNPSFSAQLYLFEQMNNQLDLNYGLYKEFQFERTRAVYIDYDTENDGIDGKNNLRQQFHAAFTLPYGHATCTIIETYICRECHRELFTNADLSRHSEGSGLFDWFMKYGVEKQMKSVPEKECQQKLFTNYLEWVMIQIDQPENAHFDNIKCPQCSTIVGKYNLNGAKCSCGRWVTPALYFDIDKIEQKAITKMNIETKNISS